LAGSYRWIPLDVDEKIAVPDVRYSHLVVRFNGETGVDETADAEPTLRKKCEKNHKAAKRAALAGEKPFQFLQRCRRVLAALFLQAKELEWHSILARRCESDLPE